MKPINAFITFALIGTLSVIALAQPLDKRAFLDLLYSVPSEEDFREARDILARRDPAQKHLFELAERRIANANTNVPKIETLVKRNTSIFDYPGLISHGTISYFPGGRIPGIDLAGPIPPTYELHFSPAIHHEFRVSFNERGMITSVVQEPFRH